MLMAGLDGVENKIHPGEAASKDLYHLPPEEDALIPTVCHSLDQALDYLDKDRAFLTKGGVFTDAVHRRLHRPQDAGSHALPHGDAPGRVRHVLLPVRLSPSGAPCVKKGRLGRPFSLGRWPRVACAIELHENASPAAHFHTTTMKTPFVFLLAALAAAGVHVQAQAQQERVWRCGNEYTNNAADGPAARLQGHGRRQRHRRPGQRGRSPRRPPAAARSRRARAGRQPARRRRRPARARRRSPLGARSPSSGRPRSARPSCSRNTTTASPRSRAAKRRNYQKYLDRVAEMKAEIARNESDIAGIRREIGRLPATR